MLQRSGYHFIREGIRELVYDFKGILPLEGAKMAKATT